MFNSLQLWTIAFQAPLSVEFLRQEFWSGLPFPTPGFLPDAGIKPVSLASPSLAGGFFTTAPLGKPQLLYSLPQMQTQATSPKVKALPGKSTSGNRAK